MSRVMTGLEGEKDRAVGAAVAKPTPTATRARADPL